MKKLLHFFIVCFIFSATVSCATQKTAAELAEQKKILEEKIENQQFKFVATYVIPIGNFQSRNLTSEYDVKVTRDTIYSYLPYYGVAYQAPWNPADSPLIFNSTRFDYSVTAGKRKGSWIININMHDRINPVKYLFTIWDNGRADLIVWDASRQAISYRGEIE